MYGREKVFDNVAFAADVFESAIKQYLDYLESNNLRLSTVTANFWENDGLTEIIGPDQLSRKRCFGSGHFNLMYFSLGEPHLIFRQTKNELTVAAKGYSSLQHAELMLQNFETNYARSRLPEKYVLRNIVVFIGHGRNRLWRDLKDHLQDQHGVTVIAYETGARAGYTITEVLQDLSAKASLALLVHTGEDIDRDGLAHARENVIHETGLFQGKLGFRRAIVLLEEETNEFTNIAGLQQIRFAKANIKEAFGEVLAVIHREFGGKSAQT